MIFLYRYILFLFFIFCLNAQKLPYQEPQLLDPDTREQLRPMALIPNQNIIDNAYKIQNMNGSVTYYWFIEQASEQLVYVKVSGAKSGTLFLINSDNNQYAGPFKHGQVQEFKSNVFFVKNFIIEYTCLADEVIDKIFVLTANNAKSKEKQFNSYEKVIKKQKESNPVVVITGFWPPTNEMIRDFSTSSRLNPDGWIGENWENYGFDVVSFFPEFDNPDCTNCGQGYGDFEVDYQDTSEDFWPIFDSLNPIAIITFSRGYNDQSWELEYNYYNRTNWIGDYASPTLPTPNPPDESVENYFLRNSNLPMEEVKEAINQSELGLNSYIDWNDHPGRFVSEFMGYHGVWYRDINFYEEDVCYTAGHVHVGGQVSIPDAKEATKITLRQVLSEASSYLFESGDVNMDNIINVLDVVMMVNLVLSGDDNNSNQMYLADMNNDGNVNVQDIIILMNLILNA